MRKYLPRRYYSEADRALMWDRGFGRLNRRRAAAKRCTKWNWMKWRPCGSRPSCITGKRDWNE